MELWLAKIRPSPSHSALMKKKTEKLIEEPIPSDILDPAGLCATVEKFLKHSKSLLSDRGKRMPTKARGGCQVCIKA